MDMSSKSSKMTAPLLNSEALLKTGVTETDLDKLDVRIENVSKGIMMLDQKLKVIEQQEEETNTSRARPMWKYTPWNFGARYLDTFWYDEAASAIQEPQWDGHTSGPAISTVKKTMYGKAVVLCLLPFLALFFVSKEPIPTVPSTIVYGVLFIVSGIMLPLEHQVRKYSIIPQLWVLQHLRSPFPVPAYTFYQWLVHVTTASMVEHFGLISKCFKLATIWACDDEIVNGWVKFLWTVYYSFQFLEFGFAYAYARQQDTKQLTYELRETADDEPEFYETLLVEEQDYGGAIGIYAKVARMVSVYCSGHAYAVSDTYKEMVSFPDVFYVEEVKKESGWLLVSNLFQNGPWLGLQIEFMIAASHHKQGMYQALTFLIVTLPLAFLGGFLSKRNIYALAEQAEVALRNISGGCEFIVTEALAAQGFDVVYDAFEAYVRELSDNPEKRIDRGRIFLLKDDQPPEEDISLIEECAPATLRYVPPHDVEHRERIVRICKILAAVVLVYLTFFTMMAFLIVCDFAVELHSPETSLTFSKSIVWHVMPWLRAFGVIIMAGGSLAFLFMTKPAQQDP